MDILGRVDGDKMTTLRIDLSDYRPYENGIYQMSLTDAVKIAIEKAVEKLLPDVEINKR